MVSCFGRGGDSLALDGTHWTGGIQGPLAGRYVRGRPAAVLGMIGSITEFRAAYLGVHVDNHVVAPIRHGGGLSWGVVIGELGSVHISFPRAGGRHT
jgi:hypothetical protein